MRVLRPARRAMVPVAVLVAVLVVAGCSSAAPRRPVASRPVASRPVASPPVASPPAVPTVTPSAATARPRRTTSTPPEPSRVKPSPSRTERRTTDHTTHHSAAAARRLPLASGTGGATQVITVVATSTARTTATLQAWTKTRGGWTRHGPASTAHLGSDGLSTHASESRSATPIGSFTLTQAFGHDADPGTALPYTHTDPSYWWISQTTGTAAGLYNTMQSCAAHCAFTRGDPNEHLYYETPFYNYAVVIDYNTRNAPGGVKLGAGSAFFLHVTDGKPTAGCVSIPQGRLLEILRWLRPGDHPRILIGTG